MANASRSNCSSPPHSGDKGSTGAAATVELPDRLDSLVDLAVHRAERQRDRTAYLFLRNGETPTDPLTYGELFRKAQIIAGHLAERNLRGERVLLVYEAGLDFIVALWGCILAGAVATPMAPPRGGERAKTVAAIAADADAAIGLTHRPCHARLYLAAVEHPELARLEWLNTEELAPAAPFDVATKAASDMLALLQYSSGSTGRPKGVRITHGNILANEEAIRSAFGHDRDEVVVGILPHYHDMGLIGNLLQPFYLGATCVFMAPEAFARRPLRWLEAIARFRGTTSGGPNFVYRLCWERADQIDLTLDLGSWRVAFVGAEPISSDTVTRFARAFGRCNFRPESFLPCFGLAEATLLATAVPPQSGITTSSGPAGVAGSGRTLVCCGLSVASGEIRVVDPKTRAVCAPGYEGEIWLAGPGIGDGYWRKPDDTDEVFEARTRDGAGPYLRTGDLGYLGEAGLFVSGRLKSDIIIAGRNHHPEDLETAAADGLGPLAAAACAFAIGRPKGEEAVIAIEVRRRDHGHLDVQGAADAVRRQISAACGIAPRTIVFVRSGGIPRTTSGKLRRAACRAAFVAGELPEIGCSQLAIRPLDRTSADRSAVLRQWLAAEIATRTNLAADEVPTDAPFAVFGLDSVDLFAIGDRLAMHLSRELDPILLWECPTIELLADRLADDDDAQ
jgi:acyl-CoA synthetase (AMP-forming)/AMP-acid ligase II/acyl carrier protein